MWPEVGMEGWLRCFACLFGSHNLFGYVKQACIVVPCFCVWLLQSGSVGVFLVFLYLVRNLPPLHMHAVIFSLL